jgi:hypothetical protein
MQPSQMDYSETYPTLDIDSYNINTSSVPVNGSVFSSGPIYVDILKQDFLIPDSLTIRYNLSITTGTTQGFVCGCPVYTPFYRLEVQANGQNLETIQQYNLLQHMMTNVTLSSANKFARESAYGYLQTAATAACNGHQCTASTTTETFSVSAPLNCILSNCRKYIPLFAMPQFRLIFTLDAMSNMMGYTTGTNTSFSVSNFEVCYELYHTSASVMNSLLSNQKLYLKSISFTNIAQTVSSGSSGTLNINFNVHYNSIKSAFLLFTQAGATTTLQNNQYDSVDVTTGTGDYQLIVGGTSYPQKPLSCSLNKSGILTELQKAATTFGQEYWSIFDKQNEMDISATNFTSALMAGTSSFTNCFKFIVGVHLEKMHNNTSVFSGISSQNTAIIARINCPTATTIGLNANLILVYDTLIEFDVASGQISVKQ